MVDTSRQRKVHRTVLAVETLMKCDACQASALFLLRPSGGWKTCRTWCPGSIPRYNGVRIWKTSFGAESLGNVSSVEATVMRQDCRFKYYVRPVAVMTDFEGYFREMHFSEWLASKNVGWDPLPGEAAWRIGVRDKVHAAHLKTLHVRTSSTGLNKHIINFTGDEGTHHFSCSSKMSPLGLPLEDGKELGELDTQGECCKSYFDEELGLLSDDARCIGRDCGVSGLLVNGACSGGQELTYIAESQKVVHSKTEHSWDPRNLPRRSHIDLMGQPSPQPEDFEEHVELDQIPHIILISLQDPAEGRDVPMMTPRHEDWLTESPVTLPLPPDPLGQH